MRLNELLVRSAAARMVSLVVLAFIEITSVGLVVLDVLFSGQGDPAMMLYGFIVVLLIAAFQIFMIIRMKAAPAGLNINLNQPPFRKLYAVWAIAGGLVPMIGLAAMMAFTGTGKSVVEPVIAVISFASILIGLWAWQSMLAAAGHNAEAYAAKHSKKRKR